MDEIFFSWDLDLERFILFFLYISHKLHLYEVVSVRGQRLAVAVRDIVDSCRISERAFVTYRETCTLTNKESVRNFNNSKFIYTVIRWRCMLTHLPLKWMGSAVDSIQSAYRRWFYFNANVFCSLKRFLIVSCDLCGHARSITPSCSIRFADMVSFMIIAVSESLKLIGVRYLSAAL